MTFDRLISTFEKQAATCDKLGSPLYAELMTRCAADIADGGPVLSILKDWPGDVLHDALHLRLFGAVHALAIDGSAPDLAKHYPSTGGSPTWPETWNAFLDTIDGFADGIRDALQVPPQTNEVGRAISLLGGFLEIAATTRLPMRLLELGSSAGLLMLWDKYRYEFGSHRWGDANSKLTLRTNWSGPEPALDTRVTIASRRGCDRFPLLVNDPEHRLRLESFVWPDQLERLASLRAAVAVAEPARPPIDTASAGAWLTQQLEDAAPDNITTVVFHSVVWAYLPADEQRAITALLERVGLTATATAPLAWLRLEDPPELGPGTGYFEVRLRQWPRGEERVLATADPHGAWVRWR